MGSSGKYSYSEQHSQKSNTRSDRDGDMISNIVNNPAYSRSGTRCKLKTHLPITI